VQRRALLRRRALCTICWRPHQAFDKPGAAALVFPPPFSRRRKSRDHQMLWGERREGSPSTLAPSAKPPSGRYLSFTEREALAILHAQGAGMREITRQIERSASTISRELRRNAVTHSGGLKYRATKAQGHADLVLGLGRSAVGWL